VEVLCDTADGVTTVDGEDDLRCRIVEHLVGLVIINNPVTIEVSFDWPGSHDLSTRLKGSSDSCRSRRNEYNELNEQNEQSEIHECVERILRNELAADELAALYSMDRTRETNETNRVNELIATSVFVSTSATNNWL